MHKRLTALTAAAGLALTGLAMAAPPPGSAVPRATVVDPVDVALQHLRAEGEKFGLTASDTGNLAVSDLVPTDHNDTTTVYVQQQANGLDIEDAVSAVTVKGSKVVHVGARTVTAAAQAATEASPGLTDVDAAEAAAEALDLHPTEAFDDTAAPKGKERRRTIGTGGISVAAIPVQLVYVDAGKELRLAWQLEIEETSGQHYWRASVDAENGRLLQRVDYVDDARAEEPDGVGGGSYRVYPTPYESPNHGPFLTVGDPAIDPASPFGWHDLNGAAGADSSLTTGNNVNAYTDVDANNLPDPGSSPDGGPMLSFVNPVDLTQAPSFYRPAAVTNVFYWSNRIHDISYRFGFNEVAGNFQVNNYGRGGAANDPLNAEAQDGSSTNNAHFFTPPDGQSPRMQMYVWTAPTPDRDGALDASVIVHEYTHGISNRLTGGPSNVGCLNVQEHGGEGWSDWYALMLTMKPGYTTETSRGIGTYVLDQGTDGVGIRTHKYSTDLAVNPLTYDSIKTAAAPHGVGTVWATMLWEMTAALIDEHGSDPALADPTSGNSRAVQLVFDGMKLQPCNPGFVEARDAILAADSISGGADRCTIWKAFAKRGLGAGASQGLATSKLDGVEAFDVPANCKDLRITTTVERDPLPAGLLQTYSLKVDNISAATGNGISVASTVGANQAYVADSSTCPAVYDAEARLLTTTIGSLGAGASRVCTFQTRANSSPWTTTQLSDDFESGLAGWVATHGSGMADWGLDDTRSSSPTHSARATGQASPADQYLAMASGAALGSLSRLHFRHRTELETSFDGGVVEISTDGGAMWAEVGDADFIENGYDTTISSAYGSPIGGRRAFTGVSDWRTSVVDLSGWAGQTAKIRFRAASDSTVASLGWWVDDVRILDEVNATLDNTVTGTGLETVTESIVTPIVVNPYTKPAAPTAVRATPTSPTATKVTFTPGSNGGLPVSSFTVSCVSSNGGTTRTATATKRPVSVTSLTKGKRYHCRARAANELGRGAWSTYSAWFIQAVKPKAPTAVVATRNSATQAKVNFKPGNNGGSPVTQYKAQCVSTNDGRTRAGANATRPVLVNRLTTGKKYKCRARATNAVGTGPWSAWSAVFTMTR